MKRKLVILGCFAGFLILLTGCSYGRQEMIGRDRIIIGQVGEPMDGIESSLTKGEADKASIEYNRRDQLVPSDGKQTGLIF